MSAPTSCSKPYLALINEVMLTSPSFGGLAAGVGVGSAGFYVASSFFSSLVDANTVYLEVGDPALEVAAAIEFAAVVAGAAFFPSAFAAAVVFFLAPYSNSPMAYAISG